MHKDLLILNFEGLDGAKTWVDEAQGLVAECGGLVEIDTAQFYAGSSSLKFVGNSESNYVSYNITLPSKFEITIHFRFTIHLIEYGYFDIFWPQGACPMSASIISGKLNIAVPDGISSAIYNEDCVLAINTWHTLLISANGAITTVSVNGTPLITGTYETSIPYASLTGIQFYTNNPEGIDAWLDSILIQDLTSGAITASTGLSASIQGVFPKLIESSVGLSAQIQGFFPKLISSTAGMSATIQKQITPGEISALTMTTTKAAGFYLYGETSVFSEFTIDWGDGLPTEDFTVNTTITITHDYADETSKNISITGDLENLIYFGCSSNSLTDLDISSCINLNILYCNNNLLTALDVSSNENLIELHCYRNYSLGILDVSNNIALTMLHCNNNALTVLDVSNNINLTQLRCPNNSIAVLDISQNILLTELHCSFNLLTSLDVSANVDLVTIRCISNSLTTLDISNNSLLTWLDCRDNSFSSSAVDDVLVDLNSFVTSNGSAYLTTNSVPTATGLAAKDALELRGWYVEVDEPIPITRYWVGDSGNWSDPNHWSYTSGGEGGVLVPDETSNVNIDSNSFTQEGYILIDDSYTEYYSVNSFYCSPQFPVALLFKDFSEFDADEFSIDTTSNVMMGSVSGTNPWYLYVPSGDVSVVNTLLQNSQASGGATFNALVSDGNVDGGNNNGWDFGVRYWVSDGGVWDDHYHLNWSLSSGGEGGASKPTLEQDAIFDENSFAIPEQSVVVNSWNGVCRSMSWVGVTNNPILGFNNGMLCVYGDITFSPNMSINFPVITYEDVLNNDLLYGEGGPPIGIVISGVCNLVSAGLILPQIIVFLIPEEPV